MTRPLSTLLLLPLLALPTLLTPVNAADPEVVLRPRNVRQGEALFIRVAAGRESQGAVHWLNKEYPLYLESGDLTAVVPVVADTKAGGHTLRLTIGRGDDARHISKTVEVAKVSYPVQYLSMARKTAKQYSAPGVKEADRAVVGALYTRSDKRLWFGAWSLPSRGRLSTGFGVRRLRNGRPVGRHHGTDISAPTGVEINAPAAGVIALTGTYPKYGKCVVVDHGAGVTSLYLHMSKIDVKKGDDVDKGDRLGLIGSTGASTGPHLHWGVYACGRAIQPLQFVRMTERGIDW
jgi:murein DD-endopeptidase MepM/ murein hydrolase activator NlpD